MRSISNDNAAVRRNLDIALLRTFIAIADRSNMTAAANALHLTQSAVSQQIARLESLTGPLLLRDRRGIRLTQQGERLLAKSRRMLMLNDELWDDMQTETGAGRVRLGAPYDLVATSVAPILKRYSETQPHADVSLHTGASSELLLDLAKGKIDLAIIEEPVGGASNGERLAVDRLVWVGAKGGDAHRRTPLPVSMVAESCAFRPFVTRALAAQQRAYRTVFENGSIDATAATVRADLAVTVWLESTVGDDLQILPAKAGLPRLPPFAINLHRAHGQATGAVDALARLIRGAMGRDPRPVARPA